MYKPFLLTLSPNNSPQTNTQPLNTITTIYPNSTCSNSHKSARPPAPLHNSKPTTNESNALLQGVAYLKIVLLVDRGAAATKTKPSTLDKYHCLKAMTKVHTKALANDYCDVVALQNSPVFASLRAV